MLPIARPTEREGAVVIDANGVVVDVGPRAAMRAAHPGISEKRAEGALMPGMVNAHTHLELSGGLVPGGRGLVTWTRALAARRDALAGGALDRALIDLIAAGTVAVGDVGNGLSAVPSLGEHDVQGVFFHELVGSREQRAGDAVADALAERATYLAAHRWPSHLGYALAPHALYSVGPALLRRIFAAARDTGLPTSLHVAEDEDERALLTSGQGPWAAVLAGLGVSGDRTPGTGPLPYLESLGAFEGPSPLLVHMVHASDEDITLAARHKAHVVVCPRSNLHIGGRLPNVPRLIEAGVRIAIGTDSLASSPSLSLWPELVTLARAFPRIPARVWLAAATTGGATALRLSHLGSLEPGACPGLVEVTLPSGSRTPEDDLIRQPDPQIRWIFRS